MKGINIILPDEQLPAVKTAAAELRHYLALAAGKLVCHKKNAVFELQISNGLEEEEWLIQADANGKIRLCGGSPRGMLYSVYVFLEQVVGIRWLSPICEYVPPKRDLDLSNLNLRGQPFFRIRNIYRRPMPTDEGCFAAHSRLNQEGEWPILDSRYGSGIDFGSPSHCHSLFAGYYPPERYFRKHPEYYALVDGERNASLWFGQICFSRPGLAEELFEKLKKFILTDEKEALRKNHLPPRIYDISINDSRNFCQCPECSKRVAKYNASGALLLVLNQVADALAEFRPDCKLQTLGYFATTEPPKNGIRPAKNIIIRVCNTETYFHAPITDPINREYRQQVETWAKKAHWLYPWEYSITYGDGGGRIPLPTEFNVAENLRFFARNHAMGVFFEHEYPEFNDFYDCKVWMEAKLLENPRLDTDALMEDFCGKMYGKAASFVLAYRRELRDAAFRNYAHVNYFFPSAEDSCYLDWSVMKECMQLYVQALDAVKGHPDLLHQVRRAFMSLDFALIGTLSWFYRMEASACNESGLFEQLRKKAGRRFIKCFKQSMDDLEQREKREILPKSRSDFNYWRKRISETVFSSLPNVKGKIILAPDCWFSPGQQSHFVHSCPQAKVGAFCRLKLPAGHQGKIKFALGRWNVSAQRGCELDSRTYDLASLKNKGVQMLVAGQCRISGNDLILSVFDRFSLFYRFNWLRKQYDGSQMQFKVEVQWNGGRTIDIGILEMDPL